VSANSTIRPDVLHLIAVKLEGDRLEF